MTEVLYFGWVSNFGHDLRSKTRSVNIYTETPWGCKLDGGLLEGVPDICDGKLVESHLGGWSAVSFWDQSGDSRGNSNTSFIVHAEMDGSQIIALAVQQWPEVFNRHGFPVKPPVALPDAPKP